VRVAVWAALVVVAIASIRVIDRHAMALQRKAHAEHAPQAPDTTPAR
jgi:hypothetical protein